MSIEEVLISDLPASVILAALYNNARVPGSRRLSIEEAELTLRDRKLAAFIDEMHGGVMIGIDFTKGYVDPSIYEEVNRNSPSVQTVVDRIRSILTPELLDKATEDFRYAR